MLNFQIEQLERLPQHSEEVWQGGLIRMCSWVTGEGPRPYRPQAAVWLAVNDDRIGPPELCRPEEAGFARVVDSLVRFATDADLGGYRPGRVEVRDPALAEHLQGLLSQVDIAVECKGDLPALDRAMAAMSEDMAGGPLLPGALSGKAVTLEQMRCFAGAAKAFYEAAPWKQFTDEDLIHIEQPKPPLGMRFATVLGAGGRTFGLGFHGKPDDCWDMRRLDDPAEWFASRKRGVWHLTFGEITELPFGDADLWEDYGLPVANEEAYPCAICQDPRSGAVRPDAARLAFLQGLLQALAQTTEEQIDTGRWSIVVESFDGPAEFSLALPDLLDPPSLKELIKRGFTPDRRAMEQMHAQMDRFMADKNFKTVDAVNAAIKREFMGKPMDPSRFPPRNVLEQAQQLCYQAFDSIGRRQLQLARQALALCPDCADAHVLLAERTSDLEEAAKLYAEGVAAGERALGKERFEEDAGHFWGVVDTRPYMRARFGLAHCLEQAGQGEKAADHYRELLRLNPGDNQGVRYLYLPLLLKLGWDAEAARFMKQSQDESTANWTYTRALLAYRLGGDSAAARTELRKALKANPHVVRCLLADEEPDALPGRYSRGSREEAMICAAELHAAFTATPGALQWLKSQAGHLGQDDGSPGLAQKRRERELKRKRRSRERKRRRG